MSDIIAALRTRGRMPVCLEGWDRSSIWGYDPMTGCLYAQLWRNTDDRDAPPTVWISPGKRWTQDRTWPGTAHVQVLAEYVSLGTGCLVAEAQEALALRAPAAVRDQLLSAVA